MYIYLGIKVISMKNHILFIAILLVTTITFAQQKEDKIGINEETDLIEAVYYHENGKVSQVGTFNLDGKLHGEWVSFSAEGDKISKGSYINGRKVGKWTFWTGDDTKEIKYKNNAIASVDGVKKEGLVKN